MRLLAKGLINSLQLERHFATAPCTLLNSTTVLYSTTVVVVIQPVELQNMKVLTSAISGSLIWIQRLIQDKSNAGSGNQPICTLYTVTNSVVYNMHAFSLHACMQAACMHASCMHAYFQTNFLMPKFQGGGYITNDES